MQKNNILLFGHTGSKNHGCEAIVRATIGCLPNNRFLLFSHEPDEDSTYGIDKICNILQRDEIKTNRYTPRFIYAYAVLRITKDYEPLNDLYGISALKIARKNNVAFSIGGDNYCYSGVKRFMLYHRSLYSRGVKTVLWGCSVEPDMIDAKMRKDLSRYDLITARESITYEALRKINSNVVLAHHFTKVHGFAAAIGTMEGLDEETQFILETAALVHDIGIRNAMRQYGRSDGKLQEAIGPGEAEALLRSLGGYTEEQIDRVTYLVGNHHTYTQVEGLDYQILIEADFLVNLHEFPERYRAILAAEEKIFQTTSGKRLLHSIFLRKDEKSDT